MKPQEYSLMYSLEEKHWWFKGKRNLIFNFIDKLHKNNLKILDAGCGTGIIMQHLQKYGTVYGIDYSNEAIKFCKKRGLKNIRKSSIAKTPFKADTFDLITCLDVLYHKGIKDDVAVLKEFSRILKKDGTLIITDSAMMSLWSKHDIATEARERYSKKELTKKLEKANFKVQKITYYNTFLFPIVYLSRKISNLNKNKVPKSDIEETNPLLNSILFAILKIEARLIRFISFPFGVSIFCIAKK